MLESIIEEPGIMKFQEYMEEEGKKKSKLHFFENRYPTIKLILYFVYFQKSLYWSDHL